MISSQLRTNKVTDGRIINAMARLPREKFVLKEREEMAYVDIDIPCCDGRSLMPAMAAARLVQEAGIRAEDEILCIGAGTGYSVAVMAGLAASVIALESKNACVERAGSLFSDLNLDNAVVVEGALAEGWKAESPYNVIFIDGMVEDISPKIFEQLAEGGRLVTVVDSGRGIGRATLFIKIGGHVSAREIFDVEVEKLPEFKKRPQFVF